MKSIRMRKKRRRIKERRRRSKKNIYIQNRETDRDWSSVENEQGSSITEPCGTP